MAKRSMQFRKVLLWLTLGFVFYAANSKIYAQSNSLDNVSVNLQLDHESLQVAFNRIESQTNFRFAYKKEDLLPYTDLVVVKASRSLKQTLDILFNMTKLNWQLSNANIVVTQKKEISNNQNQKSIVGTVVDNKGNPISFASIMQADAQSVAVSNENGNFSLELQTPLKNNAVQIIVSYVGKQEFKQLYVLNGNFLNVKIVLQDLSLTLKDVQVNGLRQPSQASNSSIVFGKQAIDQTQPTSIADVLQYLPGQTIGAPDLQNAKTINLRSAFSESRLDRNQAFVNNAAFGTAIIVDGSPISNNANMQSLNIGKVGSVKNISASVSTGSAGIGPSYSADFAGSGLDLRQIPTNNIESIEVVSGVASAKYGDLTDGAIIVNRQAGTTAYQLSARFREGASNFQLEKGFSLGKKLGSLNLSLDYLYATADARDKTKYYNRITSGLMWTSFLGQKRRFKHTMSLDFSKSLDGTKSDPDDKTLSTSRFNFSSFSISDRGEFRINKKWSKSLNYNFRYSQTIQESYSQNFLNVASALFVTGDKNIGVHEGEVVPAYNYIYAQEIKGKPVNFFGRIENNLLLHTGLIPHNISVGMNYSYDANNGEGWKYDYRKPPLSSSAGSSGFKSDRPYTFSEMSPAASNFSAYLEDKMNINKNNKNPLDIRVGLRYDNQNSYSTLSPRISTNWTIAPQLKLNAAYGIATKAPSLIYTNPGPIYFDYPLIKAFNGLNGSNSLYLTYTDIAYNRNLNLKPSASTNYELGTTYNTKWIDISVTYFEKHLKDGFTTTTVLAPKQMNVYDTLARTNLSDKWKYYNTGRDTIFQSTYSKPINGLESLTKGFEVVINTRKIKAIQTSFFLTTAFYKGFYKDASPEIVTPAAININKEALYGVYKRPDAMSNSIKSTLVSTHHFPSLGFIVNITSEFFWMSQSSVNQSSPIYPIGYYDKNIQYFDIDPKNVTDAKYAHLVQISSEYPVKKVPIVYSNFHMRLSKEIGKLRLSFNAYNIFNIRPEYIDNTNPAKPIVVLNQEPSYGAELVIKF